jgi:hypothetical protein
MRAARKERARLRQGWIKWFRKEGSSSFLKKRTKKLLLRFVLPRWQLSSPVVGINEQKFFASFFQKRSSYPTAKSNRSFTKFGLKYGSFSIYRAHLVTNLRCSSSFCRDRCADAPSK